MGCCKKFCLLSGVVLVALLGYAIHSAMQVPPIPKLDLNQWWGPGQAAKSPDTSIRPFKVQFDPERIAILKQQLSGNDWYTEPLEGVGFEYGFNSKYLKEVVEFWRTKYDFTEREKFLNRYPHFKTNIQGLDIHYIHLKQKPVKGVKIIPLLMVHGWPGSFVEFQKLIPLLATPSKDRNFAFDIIIPSLPGYGYSQAAAKPGLGYSHIAVVFRNLMKRLGYNNYVVQGGDWGSIITQAMAILFPEDIYGYHTNMPALSGMAFLKIWIGSIYPPMIVDKVHVPKLYPFTKTLQHLLQETGYMHIQASKPDTIGIALMDSPVGLAAYILEKFSTWTNPEWIRLVDGGLTNKYTLTELLDNIMVYWDSKSITTSVRLYAESFNKEYRSMGFEDIPVTVPTAVARFANELVFVPKSDMKNKYLNLVHVSDFEDGGHFAAFEVPQSLADDILAAIPRFDNFYKTKKQEEL